MEKHKHEQERFKQDMQPASGSETDPAQPTSSTPNATPSPTPPEPVTVPSPPSTLSGATAPENNGSQPVPQPQASPTVAPASPATSPTDMLATAAATDTPAGTPPPAEVPSDSPVIVATEADVPPPPSPRRKIILFSVIGGALLILLTAGVVFGLYLPNTPSSVWNSSLNRTGDALEQIVTTATDPKKLEAYKSSEISGTADITVDKQQYNGTLNSKFDQSNSDSGLTVTTKDSTGKTAKLNAKVLTTLAAKSNYPDVYLQVTGLKALGLDSFIPSLTAYEGKWIIIDSSYLESIGSSYLSSSTDADQKQITSSDISAAAQAVTKVSNEYLFTTDDTKAVFTRDSFVGKETIDGLNTYHYKVSIDMDHAKAYCQALSTAVVSTEAYKKLSGASDAELAEAKKKAGSECGDVVKEDFKTGGAFDLWIDKSRKVIYKIRVTDSENKANYAEIGQNYTGGDTLGLFVKYHDAAAKTDTKFTVETNLKTNATSGSYIAKGTDSDDPYDVNITVKATPSTESVKVTKPSPVTPVQEVINKLNSMFSGI